MNLQTRWTGSRERLGDRAPYRRTATTGHPGRLVTVRSTGQGVRRISTKVSTVSDIPISGHYRKMVSCSFIRSLGKLYCFIRSLGKLYCFIGSLGTLYCFIRLLGKLYRVMQVVIIVLCLTFNSLSEVSNHLYAKTVTLLLHFGNPFKVKPCSLLYKTLCIHLDIMELIFSGITVMLCTQTSNV